MEKLLLVLLLKGQVLFQNQHLSLLNVKTKKAYVERLFLRKQNKLYWSLCTEQVRRGSIPVYCWKLEKQWARYYSKGQKTKQSIFSMLNSLCTKNVTQITTVGPLLDLKLGVVSSNCYKRAKYTLKTIRYRGGN